MKIISLTYVISTKNKLISLKLVLKKLLNSIKKDEEIVIIDGGSTDGTQEYLKNLKKSKKISYFMSEPDRGEADAYNKGIVHSNGLLIKPISDDDVFYYPGIEACKEFMLEHPSIDLLGTEGAATYMNGKLGTPSEYASTYVTWQKTKKPFSFCGLGLLIRKASFSKTGLFNPDYKRVDMEYTLRATSKKINLAWYTGINFIRIINPSSNSLNKYLEINLEGVTLENQYLKKNDIYQIPLIYIKSFFVYVFKAFIKQAFKENIKSILPISEKKLLYMNKHLKPKFIY